MSSFPKILQNLPFPAALMGFSAFDKYFNIKLSDSVYVLCACGLADLAQQFDNLEFPGLDHVDARVVMGDARLHFAVCDDLRQPRSPFLPVMDLIYTIDQWRYHTALDSYGVYRRRELLSADLASVLGEVSDRTAAELAILAGRYGFSLPALEVQVDEKTMSPREQQEVLLLILEGASPSDGLDILMKTGFIGMHWPELAALQDVEQSKEFHPEGNVWEHTLETLKYRKTGDLGLTLGLLLHDIGKPMAAEAEGRRFDRHAQIGRGYAERFLTRLCFSPPLIREVGFLVDQHMLPAAVPALPTFRTEEAMSSPLFPKLLELYRCDISSSFRGPDGYYEACKAYRAFLRHRKNPFRSADGKKLLRMYVEA